VEKQIFISYSHEDKEWLKRLLVALAPLVRRDEIDVWADTEIPPGDDWRKSIEREIERSKVAVLLVSARFLASEFIVDVELPQVLKGARDQRLTLAWLSVSASAWEASPLSDFQATIDPNPPLDQMTDAQAGQALVDAARRIVGARTLTDLSRTTPALDRVLTRLRGLAVVEGKTYDDEKWYLGHELDRLGDEIASAGNDPEWRAAYERVRHAILLGGDPSQLEECIRQLERLR
jgi:hypothetical protein